MIRNDWKEMTLGDFVTLQRGHDLPEHQRRSGNIPILGSFGITGYHDEAKARGPGVTVGRSGASFGVVSYSPVDYWPLNTALYVNNFHDNDERFAYYFLHQFDFKRFNSGSAQPSLNRNYIHPIPVVVPEFPEQQAIAHILGTLDDKIELNRRMNQTLEEMARALFKSWFVDFDPVLAKAEGREPVGMDAETAALFPDAFEESELGLIPKGWTLVPLSDLASLETVSVRPGDSAETLWEHYSIPAFDADMCPAAEEGGSIKSGKYVVPECSILVSKLNPQFPRVWMPEVHEPSVAICSTEFMPFVPRRPRVRPFLYSIFVASRFQDDLRDRATGSTGSRQRVRPREVAEITIVAPSEVVIEFFSELTAPLFEKREASGKESRLLANIRDTLLPKLLSGDLRIDDPEVFLEEIVP